MYLDKLKWLKVSFIKPRTDGAEVENGNWRRLFKVAVIFTAVFLVFSLTIYSWPRKKVCFDSYTGVVSLTYVSALDKPLNFRIQNLGYSGVFSGKYPLSSELSIVAAGEGLPIGTDLDAVTFAAHNIGWRYFNYPAMDFLYLSRKYKSGKSIKEITAETNWGAAFQVVPYFTGNKPISTPRYMYRPYLFKNQGGLAPFKRKFADGKTRLIKPNDVWLCLRPNTDGMWRQSPADKADGVPAISAAESLPLAFYVFTDLCDWQSGEWDVAKTRWLISREYLLAYGIYLPPEKIEISGLGLKTRFIFRDKMPVDAAVVKWQNKKIVVPLTNRRNELCFYGSEAPDQSIFIPFSYLAKLKNSDVLILSMDAKIRTSYKEVLEEVAMVERNKTGSMVVRAGANSVPIGMDLSCFVVKSRRVAEIADRAIGQVKTEEEAIGNLMKFIMEYLPYVSDFKGVKNDDYNGPLDIPMSPLIALWNKGKDCDGHATMAASLFISATVPALNGINRNFALVRASYLGKGAGHALALFPGLDKLITDPFPNHILLNVDGEMIPFTILEATGYGDDEIHRLKLTKRGFVPDFAVLVQLLPNGKRKIGYTGANQFQYALN